MAKNFYGATSLTGGGVGALDAIDGAGLADLDGAIVVAADAVYVYTLDADSGRAEDSPYVIMPDANAGDKRWILVSTHHLSHEPGGSDALSWGSGGGLDVDTVDGYHVGDIIIGATGEYVVLACRDYDMMNFGGNSTTSTSYVFLQYTRSGLDPALLPQITGLSSEIYAKVRAQLVNDTEGETTYVKIANVEVSYTGTSWDYVISDWTITTSPGRDGFIRVSGGTGQVGRLAVVFARKIIR